MAQAKPVTAEDYADLGIEDIAVKHFGVSNEATIRDARALFDRPSRRGDAHAFLTTVKG